MDQVLLISEANTPCNTSNGKLTTTWTIDLKLDGTPITGTSLALQDPFDDQQHAQYQHYLESLPAENGQLRDKYPLATIKVENGKAIELLQEDHSIANRFPSALRHYANDLFRQLNIPTQLLRARTLHIRVLENGAKELPSNTRSIHCLFWELLEDPILWQLSPITKVIVRRVTYPSPRVQYHYPVPGIKKVSSWPTRQGSGSTIHVLLVIARNLEGQYPPTADKSQPPNDIDSSPAQLALEHVRQTLAASGKTHQIKYHILRPGTFDELRRCLEDTSTTNGKGYFHMVHFDMHGVIETTDTGCQPRGHAYLRFADNDMIKLQNRSAQEVAQLLHEHEVGSAVINACNSATASHGIHANLARVLIQNGVSCVFAMSNKIFSEAVSNCLTTFYDSLLCTTHSFSESAAAAREKLRTNTNRTGGEGQSHNIEDWSVPVFYSDGTDLQIQLHNTTPIKTSRFYLIFIRVIGGITMIIQLIALLASDRWGSLQGPHWYRALGWDPQVERGRADHLFDSHSADVESQAPFPYDINIQALETDLLKFGAVVWSGLFGQRASIVQRRLACLWRVTGWLRDIRFIDARQFSESRNSEISNEIKMLAESPHIVREQPLMTKSAIFISRFDDLFPPEPNEYESGQARFWNFLDCLPHKLDGGRYPSSRPYLIILSNQPRDRIAPMFYNNTDLDFSYRIYNQNSILRQSHPTD